MCAHYVLPFSLCACIQRAFTHTFVSDGCVITCTKINHAAWFSQVITCSQSFLVLSLTANRTTWHILHCFFLGVKQGVILHTTQSEHVRLGIRPRQWHEKYIGVICCSVWFGLLTARGCFEYDRPSPDTIRLPLSFKHGCKWSKHRGCLTPLWMTDSV